MFPTWRDVEVQSEIRNTRMQEAAEWHILSQLPGSHNKDLTIYAGILARLGTWMVNVGQQLRSRYGEVASVEHSRLSIEQGC